MLELRPTCEHCDRALPPASDRRAHLLVRVHVLRDLRREVLRNVCPNCGGGFVARPIRPARNWKGGNYLGKDPASTVRKHRPVDPVAHARFAAAIGALPPEQR